MKIFVVNLERAADRREAILRHLGELGLEADIRFLASLVGIAEGESRRRIARRFGGLIDLARLDTAWEAAARRSAALWIAPGVSMSGPEVAV